MKTLCAFALVMVTLLAGCGAKERAASLSPRLQQRHAHEAIRSLDVETDEKGRP